MALQTGVPPAAAATSHVEVGAHPRMMGLPRMSVKAQLQTLTVVKLHVPDPCTAEGALRRSEES